MSDLRQINIALAKSKNAGAVDILKMGYKILSSAERARYKEKATPVCEEFMKSKEYASGDTGYVGYGVCCDMLGMCGMSGWIIFLIIVLVFGLLAAGAAAFYFFYWKNR